MALVRLHARRHLVLVVDLDGLDGVPFHPTLGVDEGDVVVEGRAEDRAHDLGGAGPIALHPDDDLPLGLGARGGDGTEHPGEADQD